MALYTVSSSGQLKIADTGVGLPVSIFYGDGSAIASAPLGGDFNKIYVFNGNYHRFASNGRLVLNAGNYESRGLLAGTALGELPLGGALVNSTPVNVVLGHITLAWQSSGQLKLTGASTSAAGHLERSAGQLKLTGSDSQISKRYPTSAGQLRVTGSVVAKTLRYEASSGNLRVVATTSAFRSLRRESTAGSLLLSGSSGESFNNYSSGLLNTSGNLAFNVFLKPTSTGLLTVSTEWYTVNRIGGISTEALASAPIAAGSGTIQDIRHATIIGSYGLVGKNSSGLITFTSTGTPYSDLSQDGTLAGAPLATNSIAEHRFNSDRTQFSQLLNIDSSGSMIFTNAVKYRQDMEIGVLILSGRAGYNNDRKSSGQLKLTGRSVYPSTRLERTGGNAVLVSLGKSSLGLANTLAGAALGSLSLAGDGASVPDRTQYTSLRTELTRGQLRLTGVAGIGVKRLSSGQLVLTGSLATSSLRNEQSAGQLKLSGSVVTRSIRTERSAGQLVMAEADAYRIKWTEESRGQLKVTGSNVHSSLQHVLTSGQLKLTGSVLTRSYRVELSNGSLVGYTTSQNPLTVNNSGLAASPLGSISIAGGLDLPGNKTLFRSIRTEPSTGLLVVTGNNVHRSLQLELSRGQLRLTGSSLPSSLRKELSSGQLRLTGADTTRTIIVEHSAGQLRLAGVDVSRDLTTERSAGQLRLTGSSLPSSLRKELSSGQLRLTGSDTTRTITIEHSAGRLNAVVVSQNPLTVNNSGLAASPLGSISIAGGLDLPGNNTRFNSIRIEHSSGQLKVTGSSLHRSSELELTSGQLRLTGNTLWVRRPAFSSAGQLKLTGATSKTRTDAQVTRGQLKLTPNGSNTSLSISGAIAGSALADHPIAGAYESTLLKTSISYVLNGIVYKDTGFSGGSAGNLVLVGQTRSSNRLTRTTAGQLVLSGTHVIVAIHPRTSAGQLKLTSTRAVQTTINKVSAGRLTVTGTQVKLVKHSETSAGQLKLTGTRSSNVVRTEITSGRLTVVGTHVKLVKHSTTSAGQAKISGSAVVRHFTIYSVASSGQIIESGFTDFSLTADGRTISSVNSDGNLHITGTSTISSKIVYNVSSAGRLAVTGRATAITNIVPPKPKPTARGGGSYVYATSWDILKPYFPDDRHILGYRELKTSGIGVIGINGAANVEFVKGKKPVPVKTGKSLADYMAEIVTAKPVTVTKQPVAIEIAKPRISQQAFLEDEMLLNGTLLEFDLIQDELDKELLL